MRRVECVGALLGLTGTQSASMAAPRCVFCSGSWTCACFQPRGTSLAAARSNRFAAVP